MGRVSEEALDRLKAEVSLAQLVRDRGVVLRKQGDSLIGLCPFHEDHSPSLVVNPEKNLWHCLGACQAGGSVIDWVMKAEGVSFRHAVEMLRRDGVRSGSFETLAAARSSGTRASSGTRGTPKKTTTVRKLDAVIDASADVQAALRQAVDFYHETLKQSPEAQAYLEKRGLKSSEMIDRFHLGFCNRTLGYHIPLRNRTTGEVIRGNLTKAGILRKSGHEHFRGSLVIPVFDEAGVVTEVYGRKIGVQARKDVPLTCTCPGRTVASGTSRRCRRARRSSFANRSSMP